MISKIILSSCFIAIAYVGTSLGVEEKEDSSSFALITIPKSGTHMVIKVLGMLTGKKMESLGVNSRLRGIKGC